MKARFQLSDYDYDLPKEFIAQKPAARRDGSRLMVIDKNAATFSHEAFGAIVTYLRPGDVLVLNDTKVIPARLIGKRLTGSLVEVLLVTKREGEGTWEALVRPGRRVRVGEQVPMENGELEVTIVERLGGGGFLVRLSGGEEKLRQVGRAPLPPYIARDYPDDPLWKMDTQRYQTVFARHNGAIAAPTAGLHFTRALLQRIGEMGVDVRFLTLHVGLGTFQPIRTEDVRKHEMAAEWYEIPDETADAINSAKSEGRRIVAVGTTCCRALEDAAANGRVKEGSRLAKLYIYPSYQFQIVDVLVTNFHLPRSTLILLVSAFAGRELILSAYQEAKEKGYRFYSYGDAMLIT